MPGCSGYYILPFNEVIVFKGIFSYFSEELRSHFTINTNYVLLQRWDMNHNNIQLSASMQRRSAQSGVAVFDA